MKVSKYIKLNMKILKEILVRTCFISTQKIIVSSFATLHIVLLCGLLDQCNFHYCNYLYCNYLFPLQ